MNAADFIDFAAKIAATYADAAACRSAISRAYYGAFHVARSFLDHIGSRPYRNANAHVFVQHRLMNSGHDEATRAGRLLQDLFANRLRADYSLSVSRVENSGFARTAVEWARRIQSLIESCNHDDASRQIKQGIAEYERRITGE
jgi:uncharacterized protein (UPF0332 family)